ncbi:MAG: PTS transporter subunit EIIC, partial [Longicatena sp.]
MMKNNNYIQLADQIIECIGSQDNVSFLTHCVTRLRFVLKDKSVARIEEIENLDGVMGCQWQGGQLQIIIGQDVDEVYKIINTKIEITDDQLPKEADKETSVKKKGFKEIGSAILDGFSGCLTPIIPMLIVSAIFKTLTAVLGANMLNAISETSDVFILFTFVGDTSFYFLPIAVGYTAAKKFGASPILGILMGAILIHPTFLAMASEGKGFTVLGIPSLVQNYTSSIIPSILSVWVLSYVEKVLNNYIPAVLKTVFCPFLTILIMLPLALCIFGPAGHFLGEYISNFFMFMGQSGGITKILAIA